MLLLKKVILEV